MEREYRLVLDSEGRPQIRKLRRGGVGLVHRHYRVCFASGSRPGDVGALPGHRGGGGGGGSRVFRAS